MAFQRLLLLPPGGSFVPSLLDIAKQGGTTVLPYGANQLAMQPLELPSTSLVTTVYTPHQHTGLDRPQPTSGSAIAPSASIAEILPSHITKPVNKLRDEESAMLEAVGRELGLKLVFEKEMPTFGFKTLHISLYRTDSDDKLEELRFSCDATNGIWQDASTPRFNEHDLKFAVVQFIASKGIVL